MSRYTNPLNDIKIASPCAANWDEMLGDNRRRHCAECRLNVYNLSEMTRDEAENFLINVEGRVCIKFYRRADGTVLTSDCPVSRQKLKKRAAHFAAGVFAMILTFFHGLLLFKVIDFVQSFAGKEEISKPVESKDVKEKLSFGIYGTLENLPEIKSQIFKSRN